uniref:Uncharacterized protein n=1 Tax=Prolemur simus TaxID=1328070 RepID=A0A8C8ZU75_PROSS
SGRHGCGRKVGGHLSEANAHGPNSSAGLCPCHRPVEKGRHLQRVEQLGKSEATLWTHRVRFLEERALPRWATFTIWNAGRQGRRLYRSLSAAGRRKVGPAPPPIAKGFYCYEDSQERPKPRVPVLHFRAARPPFVICVKLDLTGGVFEDNLRSLRLQEGRDFLLFS